MAGSPEDQMEQVNWHWRNTMRPVRFFKFDARAGIPFFVLLVYFRVITIVLTVMTTFLFWFLEKRGLTFASALRAFRRWMIGENRPALYSYRYRRMKDYG